MTGRDIRYGRRGGGWLPNRPTRVAAKQQPQAPRPVSRLERSRLFHPDTIARQRAHERGCTHGPDRECVAVPDPGDLAAVWAGLARMATARAAACRPLDDLDRQALDRQGAAVR